MGRSRRASSTMDDVQKVFETLMTFPQVVRDDIALDATHKMAVVAETAFAEYPTPSGKPLSKSHEWVSSAGNTITDSPFVSEKQQRGFFAGLGAGDVDVPYVRKGTLGASWTSDVKLIPEGVAAVVGTKVPHAPLVIGDEATEQAEYHKGTWTPVNKSVTAMLGDLYSVFIDAVIDGIKRFKQRI